MSADALLQVMFITSLFYLLAASDKSYLPMEYLSRVSPTMGTGNKLGRAVEEAIG